MSVRAFSSVCRLRSMRLALSWMPFAGISVSPRTISAMNGSLFTTGFVWVISTRPGLSVRRSSHSHGPLSDCKDAAEALYYDHGGRLDARLTNYTKDHRSTLNDDELKTAQRFLAEGISRPKEKEGRHSGGNIEASMANFENIWKRCEKFFFEKSDDETCRSILSCRAALRLAIGKKLVEIGKPLDWFNS